MNEDYADLFCELFDGLGLTEFRSGGEGWIADAGVLGIAADVEAEALDGALEAAAVFERVERTPDGERPRLGSRCCAASTPRSRTRIRCSPAPRPLRSPSTRFATPRTADSIRGALPGALLPRFARPGRSGQLPNDLADAFGAVVRVDAREWEACDHRTLPAHARLARPEREAGLRIAAAPMIREPDELHWEVYERGGLRFYRIHPADREPTRRRIERVIAGWDDHDVTIGIVPELCLSPDLLECWQAALRGREHAATSRLRLVLAGERERRGLDASGEYRRAARRDYG